MYLSYLYKNCDFYAMITKTVAMLSPYRDEWLKKRRLIEEKSYQSEKRLMAKLNSVEDKLFKKYMKQRIYDKGKYNSSPEYRRNKMKSSKRWHLAQKTG